MAKRRRAQNAPNFKVRQARRPVRTTGVKSHVNPDDLAVRKACQDKRQFLTKQRAACAVSKAEKRTGLKHRRYHCRFCGYFHIFRVRTEEGEFIKIDTRNLVPIVSRLEPKVC